MNKDSDMNIVLRRVALVMGLILLGISIYWSQDGFNFDIAGDSGGTKMAIVIGYTIAIAVTVVQFVFSTSLKELNASLLVFGMIAYAYSIYTNYQGILHFQGSNPNEIMAAVLGFAMDGVPEPLIAWGLKDSLSGDFVGNLFKGFGAFITGKPLGGNSNNGHQQQQSKPQNNSNQQGGDKGKQKGFQRREELSRMYHGPDRREEKRPERMEQVNRFNQEEE